MIIVLRKESDATSRESNQVRIGIVPHGHPVVDGIPEPTLSIAQVEFKSVPGFQFRLELRDPSLRATVRKIEQAGTRLGELFYVNWGLRTGTEERTRRLITEDGTRPNSKKLIRGESIVDRYVLEWGGQYLAYEPDQLVNPLFPEVLNQPKIVIRKIAGGRGLFASYDPEGFYPFSTIILALPFAALEGVARARASPEAVERSRAFDPLFVLAVINSKAARCYFDAMVTDGLSVAPDQVRQIPLPSAPAEVQADIRSRVTNLLRLRRELREQARLASFRHVVSSRVRVKDGELGSYLNRLGESGLAIGGRMDGVSRARNASLLPVMRGDRLILRVDYQEGRQPTERTGEIACDFGHPIGRFLELALQDRERPDIGSGRLLAKVRAIAVPQFDSDWERNLALVAEIVSTVELHEAEVRRLTGEVEAEERKIDDTMYRLYALDAAEVAVVESHSLTLPAEGKAAPDEESEEP